MSLKKPWILKYVKRKAKAKSQFLIFKKYKFTLGNTHKELQNPSVTKIYSVGFNDSEQSYKNEFKRSSLSGEILCKISRKSDWPRKFWGYRVFHYMG